jgi:uncharacterized membrane protein YjfL (UPF0719 family)
MEGIMMIASLAGAFFWIQWYLSTWPGKLHQLRRSLEPWLLPLVPAVCMAVIWVVLSFFAASDVVSDFTYILLYFGTGALWLRAAEWLFRFLGISAELDIIDRSNRAALLAYGGGLLGIALCYSGGNIGEGPGVEVVFFSAGLATLGFFVVWFLLTWLSEVDYTVTVERDLAAGLRLGAFLAAVGLILGRSVVGNWVSYQATLMDFFTYGWPVLLVLALAVVVEFLARPSVERPVPPLGLYGILPAIVYLGMAVVYLLVGNFPP